MLTPTLLAERAALGALLLGDDTECTVLRWLRPGDFSDPWHREVYRTARDQAAAGQRLDTHTVGLRLVERLGHSRADLVRLTDLLRVTPRHPDRGLYAGMVLDAALRREIAGLGVLIRAGALTAVLDGTSRPLVGVAAAVEARICGAERQWQRALAPPGLGEVARPEGGTARRLGGMDSRLGADRLLVAHPMPSADAIAEREADLVAAVVARPAFIETVRSWLHPEAIVNDAWRPIYRSAIALAHRGDAIDPVTVLWESTRVSAKDAPCVSPAQVLGRVEAVLARHPGRLARDVAADHLRLRADSAAIALHVAADDRSRTLPGVFEVARAENAAVRTASRPLAAAAPARQTAVAARGINQAVPARTLEAG